MVRRSFWMVVGAVLGVWLVAKVQRAAASLTPKGAAEVAQRRLRHLRNDLSAALAEGRRAKQATEVELRQAARPRPAIDVAASSAQLTGVAYREGHRAPGSSEGRREAAGPPVT